MFEKIYATMLFGILLVAITGPWYGLMGWNHIPWYLPVIVLVLVVPPVLAALIDKWRDR